jgi:hypothetical protein
MSMSLKQLQEQWLTKWDEMHSTIAWPHITLAAPFFSVHPDLGRVRSRPTILMVGKATHRSWYMDTFDGAKNKPISERIEEREDATRDFLEYHANRRRSLFWVLFRSLAMDASVIWTNTAKIGVCRPPDESKSINPWGPFLKAQEKLAENTLLAELQEYKPDLVFIVTGNDELNCIVDAVFEPKDRWKKGSAVGKPFWFLRPSGGLPPVLHTGHPGFKTAIERNAWVDKAKELLASNLAS